jgi:hypothetical protein
MGKKISGAEPLPCTPLSGQEAQPKQRRGVHPAQSVLTNRCDSRDMGCRHQDGLQAGQSPCPLQGKAADEQDSGVQQKKGNRYGNGQPAWEKPPARGVIACSVLDYDKADGQRHEQQRDRNSCKEHAQSISAQLPGIIRFPVVASTAAPTASSATWQRWKCASSTIGRRHRTRTTSQLGHSALCKRVLAQMQRPRGRGAKKKPIRIAKKSAPGRAPREELKSCEAKPHYDLQITFA